MKSSRAIILGAAATVMVSFGALAQGSRHGTILLVDEPHGTVTISEAPTGTTGSTVGATAGAYVAQEYKLQDGLLFNALRVGDVVTFTAEEKDGVKTITNLQEK